MTSVFIKRQKFRQKARPWSDEKHEMKNDEGGNGGGAENKNFRSDDVELHAGNEPAGSKYHRKNTINPGTKNKRQRGQDEKQGNRKHERIGLQNSDVWHRCQIDKNQEQRYFNVINFYFPQFHKVSYLLRLAKPKTTLNGTQYTTTDAGSKSSSAGISYSCAPATALSLPKSASPSACKSALLCGLCAPLRNTRKSGPSSVVKSELKINIFLPFFSSIRTVPAPSCAPATKLPDNSADGLASGVSATSAVSAAFTALLASVFVLPWSSSSVSVAALALSFCSLSRTVLISS